MKQSNTFEKIQMIHGTYHLNNKKIAVLQRLFNYCVVSNCTKMNVMTVTNAKEFAENIEFVNKENRKDLNDSFDQLINLLSRHGKPRNLIELNEIIGSSKMLIIKGKPIKTDAYNAELFGDDKILVIKNNRGKPIIRIYDILNLGFFKNHEVESRIRNTKDAINDKLNKF